MYYDDEEIEMYVQAKATGVIITRKGRNMFRETQQKSNENER